MNRTLLNLFIDLVLACLFLAMIATGYILAFALPPGTNKAAALWALTRHEWGTIHSWISLVLVGTILLHLALHWQWIISVIAKHLRASKAHPSQLRTGLIAIVVIGSAMSLFAWSAQRSVKPISESVSGVCPPDDQVNSAVEAGSIVDATQEASISYWRDINPIFEKKCISCHGPARQANNFRVDQRAAFFRDSSPLIVPGSSFESPLIEIVSGNRKDMKLAERHRVDETELNVLKQWIDAGAQWPAKSIP